MKPITSDSLVDPGSVSRISITPGKPNVAVMNAHLKLMRLVIAATFGSLLWAGCSSNRPHEAVNSISTESASAVVLEHRSGAQAEPMTGILAQSRNTVETPGSVIPE